MAALDFPASPTVGQIYTANGRSWKWDGAAWISANLITSIGVTGSTMTIYGSPIANPDATSMTFANSVNLTAASTKTLTLNGGGGSNGLVIDASNNVSLSKAIHVPGGGGIATNEAFGTGALVSNTTGSKNTASGYQALVSNTTGDSNTASGHQALVSNTTGDSNAASGAFALYLNTTGEANTASGAGALQLNTTGGYNTACGFIAGYGLTTGSSNSFFGKNSGNSVTTGHNNVILGSYNGAGAPISATGSGYVILSDSYGAVRGTFDASGNLGIGTTSPVYKVDVRTAAGTAATQGILTGSNAAASTLSFGQVGAIAWDTGITATNGNYVIGINSGNNAYTVTRTGLAVNYQAWTTNGSERMRLDSAGNLGIGTTSPSVKLEVLGTIVACRSTGTTSTASIQAQVNDYWTTPSYRATSLIQNDSAATGTTCGLANANLGTIFFSNCTNALIYTNGVPLVFGTSAVERARIDASGNLLVTGVGGLGYGTGSGGAITQITSRTTGVTLNKTNGAITLVSAAGLATYQTFTVTNSTVAATDVIHVCQKSGTDKYIILVTAVAAGSFAITFATTGGTTTEQPVFNFAIIKAVTA
jgi:hypothetical protein